MKPTSLQRFCQEQGCDLEGCLGNRLFWATDAQGAKTLKLDLPHHKNFNAWDAQPMAFTLPESLTDLFRRYFKWGHKILTEYQGHEGVQYCFVDKLGRPFSDATFCLYWQSWLQKSADVRVSPQSAASRQQLRQEMLGDQEDEEDEEDLVIDLTYDE
ncbi:hypothetical protein WJX72_002078 [[Myrmecia] bisecta]|uniref:Uncharacterized protein n=1 Tax=[Myrmecia] bisecta TaxID=41462 RepID=A0AAW1P284_9CHLO